MRSADTQHLRQVAGTIQLSYRPRNPLIAAGVVDKACEPASQNWPRNIEVGTDVILIALLGHTTEFNHNPKE